MTMNRPSEFEEAFRTVTGQAPDPMAVAAAMRDPNIKRQVDELVQAIRDLREDEGDAGEDV